MPIVRVELFAGRPREQKAEVAKQITETMERVLGVPPELTQVLFFDVEKADWAVSGELYDTPKKP